MHRIDSQNAVNGKFVPGNPAAGTPPTFFSAAWCNAQQEEIAYVIEQAGIDLDKNQNTQLMAAIQHHIQQSISDGSLFESDKSENGWQMLPSGMIYQWGRGEVEISGVLGAVAVAGTANVVFPIAYPNKALFVIPSTGEDGVSGQNYEGYWSLTEISRGGAKLNYSQIFGSSSLGEKTTYRYFSIGF